MKTTKNNMYVEIIEDDEIIDVGPILELYKSEETTDNHQISLDDDFDFIP